MRGVKAAYTPPRTPKSVGEINSEGVYFVPRIKEGEGNIVILYIGPGRGNHQGVSQFQLLARAYVFQTLENPLDNPQKPCYLG